jgi:hypothetical protein
VLCGNDQSNLGDHAVRPYALNTPLDRFPNLCLCLRTIPLEIHLVHHAHLASTLLIHSVLFVEDVGQRIRCCSRDGLHDARRRRLVSVSTLSSKLYSAMDNSARTNPSCDVQFPIRVAKHRIGRGCDVDGQGRLDAKDRRLRTDAGNVAQNSRDKTAFPEAIPVVRHRIAVATSRRVVVDSTRSHARLCRLLTAVSSQFHLVAVAVAIGAIGRKDSALTHLKLVYSQHRFHSRKTIPSILELLLFSPVCSPRLLVSALRHTKGEVGAVLVPPLRGL